MRADEKSSCECWLAKVSSWSTLRCIQMQEAHLCLLFSSFLFWKFLPNYKSLHKTNKTYFLTLKPEVHQQLKLQRKSQFTYLRSWCMFSRNVFYYAQKHPEKQWMDEVCYNLLKLVHYISSLIQKYVTWLRSVSMSMSTYIPHFNLSPAPFEEQVIICDRRYQPQRRDTADLAHLSHNPLGSGQWFNHFI